MGYHIKPTTVVVTSLGDGQLKITLELDLNINLNAPGLATAPAPPPQGDFGGFVVPEFEAGHKVGFGKKVEDA